MQQWFQYLYNICNCSSFESFQSFPKVNIWHFWGGIRALQAVIQEEY